MEEGMPQVEEYRIFGLAEDRAAVAGFDKMIGIEDQVGQRSPMAVFPVQAQVVVN